jgi:arginine/lysine/ornithine decarboxylase
LDEGGLEQPIDPEDLKRLLREHASVQGVIITSPTYFGVVQPVGEIAAICREHGIPLIVDEAHGAHFGFHPYLPPSAMDVGADVAIQSTHKMLTSMTMSSMLHLKGEKVDVQEVAHWLRVIESSSPSYPLMASLDLARRWIAINGKEELEKLLARLNHFRGNIEYLRRIQEIAFPEQDPLKFSLCAANGVAGFALADWLEREGIYPELADHQKVLFVFSIGTSERDLDTLAGVLRKLDEEVLTMPAQSTLSVPVGVMQGQPEVSLREIRLRKKRNVPLQEAVDQISTEMIIPYPPGIPLVLPGERFREEVVHFLFEVLKWGGKVRGVGMFTTPMVNVLI